MNAIITNYILIYVPNDMDFFIQVKDLTMENAKLLIQIDNCKLAHDDFNDKWVLFHWNSNEKTTTFINNGKINLIYIGTVFDFSWGTLLVCRTDKEKSAREELEHDLEDLKKTAEDTRLNCEQKKKEIELVKEELVRLKTEHKDVRLYNFIYNNLLWKWLL